MCWIASKPVELVLPGDDGIVAPSSQRRGRHGIDAHTIDHIVLGIDDLQAGTEAFAELTGVLPAYGGAHPTTGTHNALVSLGDDVYLEILAPNPDVTPDPADALAGVVRALGGMSRLTPFLWAVTSTDLVASGEQMAKLGLHLCAPVANSRRTPVGELVSWQGAIFDEGMSTEYPFFIQWGDTESAPAPTSPSGCLLKRLTVTAAGTTDAAKIVEALALPVEVRQGDATRLTLELNCPKGDVTLRG